MHKSDSNPLPRLASGDAGADATILVMIKFKVRGNLRFLSHAETIKLFQRACVRAGVEIQHSRGFNPRPKLSLPLPRSVGVESDDELLCLWILSRQKTEGFKARLSEQLPEGCRICTVNVAKAKTLHQPCLATYMLEVQREHLSEELKSRISHLLASESLNLRRRTDAKSSKFKDVDVRGFLKSIKLDDRGIIVVECKVGSAGSIRIDEILKLLELNVEKLAAPIRRTSVQWQISVS